MKGHCLCSWQQLLKKEQDGQLTLFQLSDCLKRLSKFTLSYFRQKKAVDQTCLLSLIEKMRPFIVQHMSNSGSFDHYTQYWLKMLSETQQGNRFQSSDQATKVKTKIKESRLLSNKQKYYNSQQQKSKSITQQVEKILVDNAECLNNTLYHISQGTIKLINKCIGLSDILYQNHAILQSQNVCFKNYGISERELFDQKFLPEILCAVANQGGGFIIAGIDQNKKKVIKGIHIAEKVKKYSHFFQNAHNNIFPSINSAFDLIQVKRDYFANPELSLVKEDSKFCVRFFVSVKDKNKVHYLKIKKQGYHNLFEIHDFQQYSGCDQRKFLLSQHQIYQQIQKKFQKAKKQPKLSFDCIGFSLRKTNIQDFLNSSILKGLTDNSVSNTFKAVRKNEEPKFLYKQSSFLIVGSEKKNQFIEMFKKSLKEEKKIFSIFRPYQKFLVKGGRVVWFFTYEDKFNLMKAFIKKYDKGSNFLFTPVTQVLRVPALKLSNSKFQSFIEGFKKIYPQQEVIVQVKNFCIKNNCEISCFFFYFSNLTASVLGFCLLQSLGIKSYCMKQKDLCSSNLNKIETRYI